jgi:hypothetical protein
MQPLATLLAVACALAASGIIVGTSAGLPARVATHFGPGGAANGWMSRDAYVATMALLALLVPMLAGVGTTLMPRRWPRLVNLPMRDYWLAAPRREATLATLHRFGLALGVLTACLMVGIHVAILEANGRSPPRQVPTEILRVLMPFGGAVAALVIAMAVRFRRRERR